MDIAQLENFIENDQLENIISLLTKKPALATQLTSRQVSPLLLACYYKKFEIAKAIAGFLPQLSIFDACSVGKFDEVTLQIFNRPDLINQYSIDGFTPLGLAAYFNHEDIARFLVLKGANVNLASKNDYHIFPIHSAVANNNFSVSKILLNAGAYPNVCQKNGFAPLHIAAELGNIELIIALLEHGAEVTLKTRSGKLPACLAAEKGFTKIAEILKDDD